MIPRSSRASARTTGDACGVTASSATGSTIATEGAASSTAGTSNAIRSVGSTPPSPTRRTSSTPRPEATQSTVHRDGSPSSSVNPIGAPAPSVPDKANVEAIHASRPSPMGGPIAPSTSSVMVTRDPASTGGDTVARRSMPVPRSAVRRSTVPRTYDGGSTTSDADRTAGGGTSRTTVGAVSMSSVRNTTSTRSPSASTSRSNAPPGCTGSTTRRHAPNVPSRSMRYSASTRMDDSSPRTWRARSASAGPRARTALPMSASTIVRAGHDTSANGFASLRSPIEARSGDSHANAAAASAAPQAHPTARRTGAASTRIARGIAAIPSRMASSANACAPDPVRAVARSAAMARPRTPSARSTRRATSTSGGWNRKAGITRQRNHATPATTKAMSSDSRSQDGKRSARSRATAASTAATPNASASMHRSTTSIRRRRARAARRGPMMPSWGFMRASTFSAGPTRRAATSSPGSMPRDWCGGHRGSGPR